jgi:hypothetical protein
MVRGSIRLIGGGIVSVAIAEPPFVGSQDGLFGLHAGTKTVEADNTIHPTELIHRVTQFSHSKRIFHAVL